MYACPIGEVAKDGCLVYQETLMSQLPEKPIIQTVLEIKQLENDSIYIYAYKVKAKSKFVGLWKKENRDFDINDIEKTSCPRIGIKVDQLHYHFENKNCKKLKDQNIWVDYYYDFTPSRNRQETSDYTDQYNRSKEFRKNHTILYFIRRPYKDIFEE